MSGRKYDKKKSHVNIIKKTGTSGKLCDQQNKKLHKKKKHQKMVQKHSSSAKLIQLKIVTSMNDSKETFR